MHSGCQDDVLSGEVWFVWSQLFYICRRRISQRLIFLTCSPTTSPFSQHWVVSECGVDEYFKTLRTSTWRAFVTRPIGDCWVCDKTDWLTTRVDLWLVAWWWRWPLGRGHPPSCKQAPLPFYGTRLLLSISAPSSNYFRLTSNPPQSMAGSSNFRVHQPSPLN